MSDKEKPSKEEDLANIDEMRKVIDTADSEIIQAINRRLEAAEAIGRIKKRHGMPVVDFSRERQVLNQLNELNKGLLPPETLRYVYTEIMAASRRIQKPLEVAYLGPEATFTHMAAMHHFGHATKYAPQASIADVFDEVEKNKSSFGVVPVENSIEGAVNYTLDLFFASELNICAEIYTPISHALLSKETSSEEVRVIYSHPQAFPQCRAWLRRNMPDAELIEVGSTSEAARMASEKPGTAAIGSGMAALVYDLLVLASNIQDVSHNVTRFLVIGRDAMPRTGADKTSFLFATPHVPGALYRVLEPVAKSGINMVKLESRPAKNASWHYLFFVDVEGHMEDKKINEVFEQMQKVCAFIKCLGSYPQGGGR